MRKPAKQQAADEKAQPAGSVDLVKLALQESLEMVDRFSAKPVFGPTGKGYLKSSGVVELEKLKEKSKGKE